MADWEKVSDKSYKLKFKGEDIFIGDEPDLNFKPKVKLKRWGDECSFDLELATGDVITPVIEDGKLKQKKPGDYEIILDVDEEGHGEFKFDILLHNKWKDGFMVFQLNTEGLIRAYQPPLSEEQAKIKVMTPGAVTFTDTHAYDIDGNVLHYRPERIVHSYVFQHESKCGDYTKLGGKNYATGQAFILYRPKATDDDGIEHWVEMELVGDNLSLNLNDDWFKNEAKYPIMIDPDIGYTPKGGTGGGTASNYMNGSYGAAVSDGTVDTIKAYLNDTDGDFKGVMVLESNLNIITNGITPGALVTSGDALYTATYSTKPSVTNGTEYYASMIVNSTMTLYYNSAPGGGQKEAYYDVSNSYSSPSNPTDATLIDNWYSIYASYTATPPPSTWIPKVIFI